MAAAFNAPIAAVTSALGGLATGLLTVCTMLWIGTSGVAGDGYGTLSSALHGELPLRAMLVLVVAKLLATLLCYASGGAGGIFAPVLFIGGMLGGSFGHLDRLMLGHVDTQLGAFALVGMGAFFAAVIRAPITSVLIIFEMTRSYGLVLPLMIANAVAYVISRRLSRVPIYEALLDQDGLHLPNHERAAATLSAFRVGDAMTTELFTLTGDITIEAAATRVEPAPFTVYPVLDPSGALLGLVSEARIRRRLAEGLGQAALSTITRSEEYLSSDTPLVDAVARMGTQGARQMAVVAPHAPFRLVGMLAMSDVMRAMSRAADEPLEPDATDPGSAARPHVSYRGRDQSLLMRAPERRD